MDIRTDIRADIHVELSVLRTVQPGVLPVAYTSVCGNAPVSLDFSHLPLDEWSTRSCRFSRGDWQCEAGLASVRTMGGVPFSCSTALGNGR